MNCQLFFCISQNHPFLADIDWEACAARRLKPVIVPKVSHDVSIRLLSDYCRSGHLDSLQLDVANFAKEFTQQAPLYSPADAPHDANTLFRVRKRGREEAVIWCGGLS